MFEECQAKFPTTYLNDEVKRYTMILADALWYLNGHFGGLQEKESHIPDIVAIPERYEICLFIVTSRYRTGIQFALMLLNKF